MTPETQQFESPYCVRIETENGRSSTIPFAVLTPKQLEVILQSEFTRLTQETGVRGARIHVERSVSKSHLNAGAKMSEKLQELWKRR